MKKNIIYIFIIFSIIAIYVSGKVVNFRESNLQIKRLNKEYEQYLNKEIYGTDVITIINTAIDNNKKLKIEKNNENNYIDNETTSIKIYIKMLDTEEKYSMEIIEKVGISSFIDNFNTIKFKSSEVKYHKKTGQIAEITFEELEN